MATKPLRPCRYPGCCQLTSQGLCPAHTPKDAKGKPIKQHAPRRESTQWHSWYSLDIWTQDLRPKQLLREPFCRVCAAKGIRTRATDVDHIVDHKGDWSKFTDQGNLQSLCHSCHSAKTMREQWKIRQKRG